jgi:hypothetical protein
MKLPEYKLTYFLINLRAFSYFFLACTRISIDLPNWGGGAFAPHCPLSRTYGYDGHTQLSLGRVIWGC